MHLTITYDKEHETIIYGRKLESGPGSNLYGIEIADYIIDDQLFIEDAKKIRNGILNKSEEILVDKTSNYNNKLYMDVCTICGDNGMTYPLDTHHIKEQNTFDKDDINKDKLSNLVILCKKHHDEVHNGNLEIIGYKDTVDGPILEYNNIINTSKNNNRKKYNEDQINIIKKMAYEFKEQKQFMKILIIELNKININITSKTINKILNDIY
jgi:DNA mismatch repair protein MutS